MTSLGLGTARALDFTYQGSLPKLAAVTPPESTSRAVTYDAAGNEATVGASPYAYSSRDLLAAADGLSYTYDGRGIRPALAVTTGRRHPRLEQGDDHLGSAAVARPLAAHRELPAGEQRDRDRPLDRRNAPAGGECPGDLPGRSRPRRREDRPGGDRRHRPGHLHPRPRRQQPGSRRHPGDGDGRAGLEPGDGDLDGDGDDDAHADGDPGDPPRSP
jgi:hypothetical protein